MPTVTPRCAVYLRISDKDQSNWSIETQRDACVNYATFRGWTVDEIFVDEGESAKTADRTQLTRMLVYLKAQRERVQYVVVYAVNRFARNLDDHRAMRARLARMGIQLRSVTETFDESADGQMQENLWALFAEHYSKKLSERVTIGMKAAIQRGRWPYPAVTGYRNARDAAGLPTFELDPERAPLVREAFELVADGVGVDEVLVHVRSRGLTTRQGRRPGRKALAEILRNPVYAGILRVPAWGIEAPAAFPPLVDGALFREVQARLRGRATPYEVHQRQNPDFPLKGFVRHTCDRHVVGYWAKGRSARYGYYDCQACRVRTRQAALEESFVQLLAADAKPVGETLEVVRLEGLDWWRDQEKRAAADAGSLMRRVAALRERKARLAAGFVVERAMDRETYDRLRAEVQAELDGAQALLDRAQDDRLDAAGLIDFAVEIMGRIGERWASAPLALRQALQEFVYPAGVTWDRQDQRDVLSRTAVTGLNILEMDAEEGAGNPIGGPRVLRFESFLRAARKLQRAVAMAA